jgi:hypothetical protein
MWWRRCSSELRKPRASRETRDSLRASLSRYAPSLQCLLRPGTAERPAPFEAPPASFLPSLLRSSLRCGARPSRAGCRRRLARNGARRRASARRGDPPGFRDPLEIYPGGTPEGADRSTRPRRSKHRRRAKRAEERSESRPVERNGASERGCCRARLSTTYPISSVVEAISAGRTSPRSQFHVHAPQMPPSESASRTQPRYGTLDTARPRTQPGFTTPLWPATWSYCALASPRVM